MTGGRNNRDQCHQYRSKLAESESTFQTRGLIFQSDCRHPAATTIHRLSIEPGIPASTQSEYDPVIMHSLSSAPTSPIPLPPEPPQPAAGSTQKANDSLSTSHLAVLARQLSAQATCVSKWHVNEYVEDGFARSMNAISKRINEGIDEYKASPSKENGEKLLKLTFDSYFEIGKEIKRLDLHKSQYQETGYLEKIKIAAAFLATLLAIAGLVGAGVFLVRSGKIPGLPDLSDTVRIAAVAGGAAAGVTVAGATALTVAAKNGTLRNLVVYHRNREIDRMMSTMEALRKKTVLSHIKATKTVLKKEGLADCLARSIVASSQDPGLRPLTSVLYTELICSVPASFINELVKKIDAGGLTANDLAEEKAAVKSAIERLIKSSKKHADAAGAARSAIDNAAGNAGVSPDTRSFFSDLARLWPEPLQQVTATASTSNPAQKPVDTAAQPNQGTATQPEPVATAQATQPESKVPQKPETASNRKSPPKPPPTAKKPAVKPTVMPTVMPADGTSPLNQALSQAVLARKKQMENAEAVVAEAAKAEKSTNQSSSAMPDNPVSTPT